MAKSVDLDETPRSAASHPGLQCLLRHVCPNTYDKYDTFEFLFQQGLLSLSRSLSTSLLVADILCARADEALKAKLLSTTMFMSGLCTFLQNTIGIR